MAIHVLENTETYTGVVHDNTLTNNTILTYNPDYAMIRVEDTRDGSTDLASINGNTYLNTYKAKSNVIEVLAKNGNSSVYTKDTVGNIDFGSNIFTYFGFKNYTNTGSLGANLLSNGTFTTDISGWSTDVLGLTYDST
jgi:hypothetical protein